MPDSNLKARHRAMWASGDYPSMVETFLLPLGPQLVAASGIPVPTRPRTGARTRWAPALDAFCDEQNLASADDAQFELEYLLAVGTRA